MSIEQKKINEIKEAIIKVVAFFDIFDFPLTAFEIWKYLSVQCDLADVQEILNSGELNKVVSCKNGTYFLSGRGGIYVTRMKRYNYANAKFKKTLRIVRLFKYIPWIKMVAIGNMIGANNLKQESDIDLFIITASQRIWLTRFICAGLAALLKLRPTAENFRDKICLSFFVSEGALDLSSLKLSDDKYLLHWLADLTPVYDRGNTYDKFIAANQWVKESLPNWFEIKTASRQVKALDNVVYSDLVDVLFGSLEKSAKNFQLRLLPQNIKAVMNKDTNVVINDDVLKLHINDRREEYNKIYLDRIFNF